MRILQIGPIPPEVGGKTQGGVATHLWGLATNLAKRGHQVGVLADNCWAEGNRLSEVKDGVNIFCKNNFPMLFQLTTLSNPYFWKRVVRTKQHFGQLQGWRSVVKNLLFYQYVIHSFQPDVVHVHHLEIRFPFAFFSTEKRIAIVTTIHSTHYLEFRHSTTKTLEYTLVHQNLNLARHLIFVSRFTKKKFFELFPIIQKDLKIDVIHNPLDSSLFYLSPQREARLRLDRSPTQPLILFVGNLILRKGAHLLIEAAMLLKSRGLNFSVIIVGDGEQLEKLQTLTSKYDLAKQVSFEGRQVYPALLDYYNSADIFVLPSSSEGFPIAVLEAMFCGCPIVGTKEAVAESISTDKIGLICNGDAYSLSEQLETALKTSWDREHIAKCALRFDWRNQISRFEKIYQLTSKGAGVSE